MFSPPFLAKTLCRRSSGFHFTCDSFELQTSEIYTRDSILRLSDNKVLILSKTLIAMCTPVFEFDPLLGLFHCVSFI